MKEIATSVNVEDEALILYIIQALPGDQSDKIVSYGAKNLKPKID